MFVVSFYKPFNCTSFIVLATRGNHRLFKKAFSNGTLQLWKVSCIRKFLKSNNDNMTWNLAHLRYSIQSKDGNNRSKHKVCSQRMTWQWPQFAFAGNINSAIYKSGELEDGNFPVTFTYFIELAKPAREHVTTIDLLSGRLGASVSIPSFAVLSLEAKFRFFLHVFCFPS